MNLQEYRKKENKTQQEMADLLGVSLIVYCSWEYSKRLPRVENMQKIIAVTNGDVKADDFYEVE